MNAPRILAGALLAASLAARADDGLGKKMSIAPPQRCDLARDADFAGDGRRRLEDYLDSLARASGGPYGIRPNEFQLLVSNAAPPVVSGHPAEGDIGCSWGKRYISLFKRTLTNRALAETYNTIAYQYFRHVQVRRDGASCDSLPDGRDAEARDWAQKIAPSCP